MNTQYERQLNSLSGLKPKPYLFIFLVATTILYVIFQVGRSYQSKLNEQEKDCMYKDMKSTELYHRGGEHFVDEETWDKCREIGILLEHSKIYE